MQLPIIRAVKEKSNLWLAVLLMVVFAATRWPGLMPPSFSAAYALAFCAGLYFPRKLAWWLPLATMAVTDVALNCYYKFAKDIDAFQPYQLMTYAGYALLIWLGRRFNPRESSPRLIGGGVLGAMIFFLLTNTVAWLLNPFGNPEYTKDWAGFLAATITGTSGHPPAWTFLLKTLLSGGLFTGLFVGAMKLTEAPESAREKEAPEPAEDEAEPAPETQPEDARP